MPFAIKSAVIEGSFNIPNSNSETVEGMAVGETIIFLRREKLASPIITRTLLNHTSVTYTWNDIDNADSYGYELVTVSVMQGLEVEGFVEEGIIIDNGNSSFSFSRTNLTSDENYRLYIWAIPSNTNTYRNSRRTSDDFNTPDLTVLAKPIITNFTYNQIVLNVTWDDVENANSYDYRLLVEDDFGDFSEINSNTIIDRRQSSFSITITLSANNSYAFYVKAVPTSGSAFGESEEIQMLFNSPQKIILDVPSNFQYISVNPIIAQISWDGDSRANGYRVTLSLDGIPLSSYDNIFTTDTQDTFSGLSEDTDYDLSVTSVAAADEEGIYTNSEGIFTVVIPAREPLDAPDVSLFDDTYPTHNSVRFNWDNIDNTNRYRYTIREGSSLGNELSGYPRTTFSSSTPLLSGLEREISYTFQVRAEPSNSQLFLPSAYTSFAFTTTKERLPTPNRPTVVFTARDVTVRWTDVANADDYLIEIIQTNIMSVITSQIISEEDNINSIIFIDDLLPLVSYSARVTALANDDSGFENSLPSPLRSFNTPMLQLPDITLIIASLVGGGLHITWEFPSTSINNISDFNVNIMDIDNGFLVDTDFIVNRNNMFINIHIPTGIGRGGSFRGTITANPEDGYIASSGSVDFSLPSIELPRPRNLVIDMETDNGARATWESVDNATSYILYVFDNNDSENPILTFIRDGNTNITYTFSSNILDPFTFYRVNVIARGGVGLSNSGLGIFKTFRTTRERLPTPSNFDARNNRHSGATMTWNRVTNTNASGYRIEIVETSNTELVDRATVISNGTSGLIDSVDISVTSTTSVSLLGDLTRATNYTAKIFTITSSSGFENSLPATDDFTTANEDLPALTVTATADDDTELISITWSLGSPHNSTGVDHYEMFIDVPNGIDYIRDNINSSATGSILSYDDIGRAGTFRVRLTLIAQDGYDEPSTNPVFSNTFTLPSFDLSQLSVSFSHNTIDDEIDVTWSIGISANENINSWRVQVLISSSNLVVETFNTNDSTERNHTFTYADIGALGTYKIRVTALASPGFNNITVTTDNTFTIIQHTLTAPTDITFSSIDHNSFIASWDAGDNIANRWRYRYRKSDSTTWLNSGGESGRQTSSMSFTTSNNLDIETEYIVEVRAEQTNTIFYSPSEYYSENVSTTAVLPNPPTITSVTYDGSTITVNWRSVSNATSYHYFISAFPNQALIIPVTATETTSFSTTINIDENTATYMWIGVASTSSAGTSLYSSAYRALQLRTPTGLRNSSRTTSSLSVIWNSVTSTFNTLASSLSISGTIVYETRIEPNIDSNSPSSDRNATFTGLDDNTSYTIYVKATLEGYGDSEEAAVILTTRTTPIPATPIITEIIYNGSEVRITWNPVDLANNYSCYISVFPNQIEIVPLTMVTSTEFIVDIDVNEDEAQYLLVGVSASNQRGTSSTRIARRALKLRTPTGLDDTDITPNIITVDWNAVTSTAYSNYGSFDTVGTVTYETRIVDDIQTPTSITSQIFAGLSSNTSYRIYVKATLEGYGDSNETSISLTTTSLTIPNITNIVYDGSTGELTVTWTRLITGSPSYSYYVSVFPNQEFIVPVSSTYTQSSNTVSFTRTINIDEDEAQYLLVGVSATYGSDTSSYDIERRALKLRTPRNFDDTSITTGIINVDWDAPIASTSYSGSSSLNTIGTVVYETRIGDDIQTPTLLTSARFAGLTSNTSYTMYVKATLEGYGDSDEVSITRTTTSPVSPNITSVEYDGSTGELTITWTRIITDAPSYSYYVSVFPNQEFIIPVTSSGYIQGDSSVSVTRTINVNEDEAQYLLVGVSATYGSDTSSYDIERRALKLRTPSRLRSTSVTQTIIDVAWNAPSTSTSYSGSSNLNTVGTFAYEARIVPASGNSITSTLIRSARFAGLTSNTSYTMYVKATLEGYGDSDEVSITRTTTSPVPPNITSVEYDGEHDDDDLDDGNLTIRCNTIVEATSYDYYVHVIPGQNNIARGTITTFSPNFTLISTNINNVSENAEYMEIGVRANYGSDTSTYDIERRALKLRTPTGLDDDDITINTITIDWNTVSTTSYSIGNNINIEGTVVYETRIGDDIQTPTLLTSARFAGLTSNTSYTMYVKATLEGYGDSDEVSITRTTTSPVSPNITSVEYDGSTGELTITWTRIITDAPSYSYYVSVFPNQEFIIPVTSSGYIQGDSSVSVTRTINVNEDEAQYLLVGVSATYGSDTSSYDIERRALKLRTPSRLRSTSVTQTIIDVAWNAPSTSTSYSGSSNLNTVGTFAYEARIENDTQTPTLLTSAIFAGLTSNTSYTMYVKATLEGYGDSDEVSITRTTTSPVPPNITSISYDVVNSTLTVTWPRIITDSPSYQYYVSVFPDQENIVSLTSSNINQTNTTVTATIPFSGILGTAEYLEVGVRANYGSTGSSTYDIERRALKLRTPTSVSRTQFMESTTYTINWSHSSGTFFSPYTNLATSGTITYETRIVPSSGVTFTSLSTIRSNIFTGLRYSTSYTVYVKATLNGYGDSDEGNVTFTTPRLIVALPEIRSVTYDGTTGQVSASWNHAENAETYGYFISVYPNQFAIALGFLESERNFIETIDVDESTATYLEVSVWGINAEGETGPLATETRALKLAAPNTRTSHSSDTSLIDTISWRPVITTSFSSLVSLSVTGTITYEYRTEASGLSYNPFDIAIANNKLYIIDGTDDTVFVHNLSGNRLINDEFRLYQIGLINGNNNGTAIDIANNNIYITEDRFFDSDTNRMFIYNINGNFQGTRSMSGNMGNPRGIAVTNTRIYVLRNTNSGNSMNVYNLSGNRIQSEEFILPSGSVNGMSVFSNRLYITYYGNLNVFVYDLQGSRQTSEEFNLLSINTGATGIAVGTNRAYVLDQIDNRVYVYDLQGNRQISEEFNLDKNIVGSTTSTGVSFTRPTESQYRFFYKATLNGYGDSNETTTVLTP